MPATALPSAVRATPEVSATSWKLAAAQILEQEVRHRIVRHEDIGQPIAVKIAERHAHAFAYAGRDPRRARHIRERAVVVVMKELVGQPRYTRGWQ